MKIPDSWQADWDRFRPRLGVFFGAGLVAFISGALLSMAADLSYITIFKVLISLGSIGTSVWLVLELSHGQFLAHFTSRMKLGASLLLGLISAQLLLGLLVAFCGLLFLLIPPLNRVVYTDIALLASSGLPDKSPPRIILEKDRDIERLGNRARADVLGRAVDDSKVVMVTVNGKEVELLDDEGNFRGKVLLKPDSFELPC